jgi:signal transduction histidine kinase
MSGRLFERAFATQARGYVAALAVTIVALIARGIVDPVVGAYVPYLAVLPAVVFSAWWCGLGPSVVATVLCFVGEQYWFLPPYHTLALVSREEVAGTVVYFLVSAVVIALAALNRRAGVLLAKSNETLQQTTEELRRSHEELESRVKERTREVEQKHSELLTQMDVVRDLSGRLLQMQDEERRRIARALHDSVGQIAAALSMNLSAVNEQGRGLSPKAGAAVADSVVLVQELSREIRTISHLLHPPLLDEVGLASALQWFVEGFSQRSGIETQLELSGNLGRLPEEMETCIFRMVQECLTNVHRHSGSPTATVRISRFEDRVSVEIRDTGQGMPVEKKQALMSSGSVGVGIRGMQERLRQFGGTLIVKSENGAGTVLQATLSLSPPSSGAASRKEIA